MVKVYLWLLLAVVFSPNNSALGRIVINELLPDPVGADGGKEFVELINSSAAPVNLSGLELQFANGAEEAHWVVRWSCQQDIFLDPGERFLLADRNWQGTDQAAVEVYLGLQNGPDAIRLVRGTEVLDLVGYGPLTDQELMEEAAPLVVPGKSLARRPDGNDTDDNAQDFVATEPSPGRPNFRPYEIKVISCTLEPPSGSGPPQAVTINLTLENVGTEFIPLSQVTLNIGAEMVVGLLDENYPGQQRTMLFQGTAQEWGTLNLTLLVPIPVSPGFLEIILGSYQMGPAHLVLNEVMGAPNHGQGEWIELLVTGDQAVQLADYRVKDEGGHWITLPGWTGNPGEMVVVAQDSAALAQWMADIEAQGGATRCVGSGQVAATILTVGSWANLNNSAPEDRDFADRLYLGHFQGPVMDHVTIGWTVPALAQDLPDGHSYERVGLRANIPGVGLWTPSLAQAGSTPGCRNSVDLATARGANLQLFPALLDPSRAEVIMQVGFEIQPPGIGWDLRLFDLWGHLVRDLGGENHGPGPRQLFWDGKSDQGTWVPSGAYVVLLRIRSAGGAILGREKKLALFRRPNP